ncbi:MAG: hypothetical protein IT499_05515 [Rubrivivax sp.]|jgi:hypothetical protein|nr:hypothetical protein [Rubrivivax sp.]
MTRAASAASSSPRHLPRWLRRAVRAWARCARWWARRAARPGHAAFVWALTMQLPDTLVEDDPVADRRCGWFDSSQDLREGLAVSEHEPNDAVCAQLPVMAWVQLQLSGWRPRLDDEPLPVG